MKQNALDRLVFNGVERNLTNCDEKMRKKRGRRIEKSKKRKSGWEQRSHFIVSGRPHRVDLIYKKGSSFLSLVDEKSWTLAINYSPIITEGRIDFPLVFLYLLFPLIHPLSLIKSISNQHYHYIFNKIIFLYQFCAESVLQNQLNNFSMPLND